MNRNFKVVFSKARGALMVVNESDLLKLGRSPQNDRKRSIASY